MDSSKRALIHLGNLRYELIVLKKWVYGIKSEKRHLPAHSAKVTAGYQLVLDMEVDSWVFVK